MDCAPLFIVNADDLSEALVWLSVLGVAMGLLGVVAALAVRELVRSAWLAYRTSRCRRPFSERVAEVERMRLRMLRAVERVSARRAREAAR